ncbi:uncharacterized protein JCM6883_006830 [Sporobolomyces salmoneus]|uniref:uncharacterized protein n=1 Tax=Sporobolomyces salmoneus TaxID=183962 RepID=UPI003178D811
MNDCEPDRSRSSREYSPYYQTNIELSPLPSLSPSPVPDEDTDMIDVENKVSPADREAVDRPTSPDPSHITLSSDDDEEQVELISLDSESDDSDSSSSSISIQSYTSPSPPPAASPPRAGAAPSTTKSKTSINNSATSPPSPALGIPLDDPFWRTASPNHPLPRPTYEFDPLNYAPFRNPSKPARWVPPEERELGETFEALEKKREEEKKERLKDQRVLREEKEGEEKWSRGWENVSWDRAKGSGEKGKEKATDTLRSASFFPYPQMEGLEWLKDVFVTVGGGYIDFYRCLPASSSASSIQHFKRVRTLSPTDPEDSNREEYLTCAWSVNTTTWPFTPMLAVAGVGRVIEIYLVGVRRTPNRTKTEYELIVHLDRTTTGHGGTIHQLAFHPERPHLLLSCSEDRTLRLWDPTLPRGSNIEVRKVVEKEISERAQNKALKKKKKKNSTFAMDKYAGKPKKPMMNPGESKEWTRMRPRVDGELLAVLTGHKSIVLTADFHPEFPLVVSGGGDGRIKLWRLPPSIFNATPTWPKPPHLYRHPPPPTSLVHPPVIEPFFSTILVHPGQWPTCVSFLDSPVPTIVSVAPLTHQEAATIPRTSVKIWTIDSLSTLPNKSFDYHLFKRDLSRSKAQQHTSAEDSKEKVHDTIPLKPRRPEGEEDGLGFRIEKEIVLEGLNCCIGDQIGISRAGPFRQGQGEADGKLEEAFLVVPTTLLGGGFDTEEEKEAAGLYLYKPFLSIPVTRETTSTSSKTQSKVERVSKLFPQDRERPLHDYHPRLRPSLRLEYPLSRNEQALGQAEGGEEEETRRKKDLVHFRCVAVSPGAGNWIVGVGDNGLLSSWRETRKVGGA